VTIIHTRVSLCPPAKFAALPRLNFSVEGLNLSIAEPVTNPVIADNFRTFATLIADQSLYTKTQMWSRVTQPKLLDIVLSLSRIAESLPKVYPRYDPLKKPPCHAISAVQPSFWGGVTAVTLAMSRLTPARTCGIARESPSHQKKGTKGKTEKKPLNIN